LLYSAATATVGLRERKKRVFGRGRRGLWVKKVRLVVVVVAVSRPDLRGFLLKADLPTTTTTTTD